jgi:ABC-type glycerol-3-phosphate transport system substrate-binding protein
MLGARGRSTPATLCLLVVAACGCSREPTVLSPAAEPTEPSPSVALRILVVNEPGLAEAIERLKGEWAERTGGTLAAVSRPWEDVVQRQAIGADLIVFPTRYLGELATRGWLRPVRQNVLEGKTYDASDVLPLARRELVTWGGQVMALPLCVDFPNAGLLFEAAPLVASNDRPDVLFVSETMKPRITEPSFAEALARLPSSGNVDGMRCPPLLGQGDQIAAVTSATRNAASAFKLLEWLASAEISTQLAGALEGSLPVRRSLASSQAWFGPGVSADERVRRGRLLEQALSCDCFLFVPRIPGVDDYLAALDAIDQDTVDRAQALANVAAQWEAITDRLGRDKQRAAHLKHLNLSEP